MKYEFKSGVPAAEYLAAAEKSGLRYNLMQDPAWAHVKKDWQSCCCVMTADGEPCAFSLLLIRKMAPGVKLVYCPRGYVLDYSDKETLKAFSDGVIGYAKKIGAYMVRIDPEIILSRTYKRTEVMDAEGHKRMKNLNSEGYMHGGFAKDFHSYTQPRYNAEISLCTDGKPADDTQLLASLDKKLKKFIGAYTAHRGISFSAETDPSAIPPFARISEHTEQRQHVLLRNEEYFARVKEAFGDDCVIFFARMDMDKFIAFCDEQLPKADIDTAVQIRKDRDDAVQIKQQRGNIIDLSALLTVKCGKKAYLMYSGFDDSVFPRFRTTNQLRYEAMKYFRDRGCDVFSLMGIHGELSDSLSEFKLKFNPTVLEYAGEFEYPVSGWKYAVFKKLLPAAKRVYIKIKLRKVK